jgi:hypothetical protein
MGQIDEIIELSLDRVVQDDFRDLRRRRGIHRLLEVAHPARQQPDQRDQRHRENRDRDRDLDERESSSPDVWQAECGIGHVVCLYYVVTNG